MQGSQIYACMNHVSTCFNFNIKTRTNNSGLQSYPHVFRHVCKYQTLCYQKVAMEFQLRSLYGIDIMVCEHF